MKRAAAIALLGAALLVAAPAEAKTTDPVTTASASGPYWCGHERPIVIGGWLFSFIDHWTEAGGRHMHHYYWQFGFPPLIWGTRVVQC
jgi:hypothetical protein